MYLYDLLKELKLKESDISKVMSATYRDIYDFSNSKKKAKAKAKEFPVLPSGTKFHFQDETGGVFVVEQAPSVKTVPVLDYRTYRKNP